MATSMEQHKDTGPAAGQQSTHPGQPQDRRSRAEIEAEQVGEATRQAADETRSAAREMAHDAKQAAKEAVQTARQTARKTMDDVGEECCSFVDRQKAKAAGELETVASAAHRAADKLEEEEDPNLARYTRSAANQVDRVVRYVRERDPRQILHDTEDLIRRHPEIAYGGMFMAGLAIARFMKSSARREETETHSAGLPALRTPAEEQEVPLTSGSPAPVHVGPVS